MGYEHPKTNYRILETKQDSEGTTDIHLPEPIIEISRVDRPHEITLVLILYLKIERLYSQS